MRKAQFLAWLAGVVTLLLWPLAGLAAPGSLAQVPILNMAPTQANILLIIDDSGSMYSYSKWPNTRMKAAKAASIALLDTLSNVRVGVGTFSSGNGELNHAIADLDKNRKAIYDTINAITPGGGTPLVKTLQQAGGYFVGQFGTTNPGNSSSTSCTANGKYEGKLIVKPGRTGEKKWLAKEVFPKGPVGAERTGSPICHWCQKNFIILLTDGHGYGRPSEPLKGRYCPFRHLPGGKKDYGCYHALISVAKALNEIDLRPDIDNFKGEEVTNNVVTYTVGFHTSQSLLGDVAEKGGGLYVEADDEASLKAAFAKIGEDILAYTRGSSSTPGFNQSRHKKGKTLVYLTRFDSQNWTGDVMAAPFSEAGVVGPQKWSAADLLDNNKSPHLRQMITYNHPPQEPDILCAAKSSKSVLHPRGGVPFRWDNLSDRQRQDLAGYIGVGSEGSFSFQDKWSMGSGLPSDTFETWSRSRQGSVIWGPGMPFDLATNTDGDVYVVDYNNHRVVKFNSETGKVEASWGNSWVYELQGWDFEIGGEEDEDLIFPSGIAIDMYDNVYVAQHTSHTIKKFDKDGKFLQKFGGYGSEDDDLVYPFDVAVDGSDNIYVVELQNHRIKVLDDKGKHLRTIGSYGTGKSQFKYPNRIAVDGEDNLYVSDYLNHRIQKFDSAGKFVKEWGGFGTANGDFQYPYGIDTDADNNVYVVEYKNRVQQFDSEGEHMATFATKFGTADGELRYPRGIAVADKLLCAGRSVYVADAYNHRVQRFSSTFDFKAKLDVKTGRARLEYLRGDRSNEDDKGYKFRKRESLLGDIVHSEARHVGAPPTGRKNPGKGLRKAKGLVHHPGVKIKSYSKFVNDNKLRREVLYVGSNDGMLHAFDANTGEELLAYLPGNLFSNKSSEGYHYLTDPDYGHRFYVDGSPFVGDALIKSHFVSEESWRTVLVGTEGAGGRGVFALDVTDPGEFRERNAEDLVLWEFTDQDDLQLGHVLQEPTVALLPNGRWAAIFGNGYENRNSTGWAALFIVFLDADLDGEFTEWDDYVKIQLRGVGDVPNRNGLSTPAVVDTDGDGIHDRVYAGDIHANLWVFDLSDKNPKKWRPHRLYDTGRQQPITVRPEVIRHPRAPTKGNEPNTLVNFGTGQYLVAGDNTTTNRQSFYGVWDRGDTDLAPSDLVKLVIKSNANGRVIDPTFWQTRKENYKGVNKGDRYGWYLDLPEKGERVVTDAEYRGKEIFFNTLVPNAPIPCSAGGSGWMMSLNALTGGSPKKPVFDFDGDGKITVANDATAVPGVPEAGKVGYAGSKYQGSGGVPAGSGFIGNLQFTAGTGTDDTSKLSFSGSGSGSGSGSSGSASGDENAVRRLTPIVNDDRIGRLSWQQMTPPRRATSSSVSPPLTSSSPAITPSK